MEEFYGLLGIFGLFYGAWEFASVYQLSHTILRGTHEDKVKAVNELEGLGPLAQKFARPYFLRDADDFSFRGETLYSCTIGAMKKDWERLKTTFKR